MRTTERYDALGVRLQENGMLSIPSLDSISSFSSLMTVFRLRLDWTMDRFASELNVTRQTISNWESGRCIPGKSVLEKISSVLFLSDQEKKRLLSVAKSHHRKNHHV